MCIAIHKGSKIKRPQKGKLQMYLALDAAIPTLEIYFIAKLNQHKYRTKYI